MSKEMTVEAAFAEMELKLNEMEKEDITLEESFRLYQEGMKLVAFCSESIDKIEKKVMTINEDMKLNEF